MLRQVFAPSKQIETRLRVLHAIDRPIDELTVSAICSRAGISRQLFYRYFDSKFDIPYWYTVECDRVSITEIGRSLTWEEGLEDFFTLLHEERDSLLHFAVSKESRASRHRADARRVEVFRETIERNGKVITPELQFYAEMYANCFNKAFAQWTERGMVEDPGYMAMLAYGLVPAALRDAMQPS